MPDEKNRLGDKLQNVEKAREDQWAAQQDRRTSGNNSAQAERVTRSGESGPEKASGACPHCHQQLVKSEKAGLTMMTCQTGDGAWIDKSELDKLLLRLG